MKKNFKKALGLTLVLAMTLTMLTACGKKDKEKNDSDVKGTPTTAAEVTEAVVAEPTEAPIRDLGGRDITVANWWEAETPAEPANQEEEDRLAYREEIMEKHNFTIKLTNIGTWNEYQETVVTSIMAGAAAADVFVMDQQFVAAPIQQKLLYPLQTIKSFDFTEDKWNKPVKNMMTFGENIYGMATGKMEPRLGVFFNKRLFEEAGIDPEEPYNLQASGEWTWEKLKEFASKCTRDTNNDGTPDTYGIASFSVDFFRGCVYSNNADFISKDANGFYNATGEANFLEAIQFGRSFYDEGTHAPQPEGSNWDWFIAPFKEGQVAMTVAEEYKVGTWAEMEDDWGFVLFPQGPQGEMITVFTENIVVMPATLDEQAAEDIAFAYDLFTDVTPGYEDEDWRTPYYSRFRDSRAVEETLPLMYEDKHGTMSNLNLISGIGFGDITYGVDAGTETPAEAIEKVQQLWEQAIKDANGQE